MKDWQLDFEWLRIRHYVKDTLNLDSIPDFNLVMVLIGIQELGQLRDNFSKDEKECLMHIAICHLMTPAGFFKFDKVDDEGWPHWIELKTFPGNEEEKEKYLTIQVITYFDDLLKSYKPIKTNINE